MTTPTCKECKHCTNIVNTVDVAEKFYWCEIEQGYISEFYAEDVEIGCDTFEQKLDDNQTKESRA